MGARLGLQVQLSGLPFPEGVGARLCHTFGAGVSPESLRASRAPWIQALDGQVGISWVFAYRWALASPTRPPPVVIGPMGKYARLGEKPDSQVLLSLFQISPQGTGC